MLSSNQDSNYRTSRMRSATATNMSSAAYPYLVPKLVLRMDERAKLMTEKDLYENNNPSIVEIIQKG